VSTHQPVLAAVARRLEEDPEHVLTTLRLLGDVDALAETTDDAALALARRVNVERLGHERARFRAGALTTAEVARVLGGVSRQAVASRVASGSLLALQIGGRSYFPDWQLGPDGPWPGLPRLLALLRPHGVLGADALMRRPLPEESGRTPAQLLSAGDVERALHYVRIAGTG
jgi:hypothetical protein